MNNRRYTLNRITAIVAFVFATATLANGQEGASALLPDIAGASWTVDAIQTDSAGNEQFYGYQETLDTIEPENDDQLYTIRRIPGNTYQIRTHGDTLFTDIRNAISGLLPEGIDANSLDFGEP